MNGLIDSVKTLRQFWYISFQTDGSDIIKKRMYKYLTRTGFIIL